MGRYSPSAAALVLLVCTSVASPGPGDKAAGSKGPPTNIRVTPLPLFRGDTARIAPHLGLTASGCLKVDYQGGRLPVQLRILVWHQGKLKRSQQTSFTHLDGPDEITFSLKEEDAPKGGLPAAEAAAEAKAVYRMVLAIGGETGTSWVKMPPLRKDLGVIEQSFGQATALKEGQDFDIWGMFAGEGIGGGRGDETIEAKARRAEWAVVLRLSLREWEKDWLKGKPNE